MAEGHTARGLHSEPELGRLHPPLPRPGLHFGEPDQGQAAQQTATVQGASEKGLGLYVQLF